MIWLIAWKNVWRNKVRSLVIIMAISFGLLGGIFSSAVMKGMADQRVKEAVSRETSHIQVHNVGYAEDNDINSVIHGPDFWRLEKILDTMPQIAGWSSRIKFLSMVANSNSSTGVIVYGVDPQREMTVSGISKTICDSCGSYLDTSKHNLIVVGKAFADKLNIQLHSKLVLTFQDINGNLTGGAFRVGGIYRTNNSAFDEMNIFITRSDISGIVGIQPGECHEVAVRLKDFNKVAMVQEKLTGFFPGLEITNWKQIDPLLGVMTDLLNTYLYLFMVIILVGLAFGIINTMLMVILERTHELGVLTAIGMNKGRVFLLIMLESVYLSLTGGITGMLMGIGAISIASQSGIDLSRLSAGFEKIGYNPILYPSLNFQFFVVLILMVIITGVVASIYPATKVLRQNPAEAIRHE